MDDLRDELAEITAQLLAELAHQRARGVLAERIDAGLPDAIAAAGTPIVETGKPPGTPTAGPARVDARAPTIDPAWTALARAHREAEPGPPPEAGLAAIRDWLGDCKRCKLCKGRTNIVFGVGSSTADLMIIGEGPGGDEDKQGEPFVGAAGEMLNKMITNVVQLQRSEVYIANVVKCRPPNNRNPEPDEVEACKPFLERQIRAVKPRLLLVLGGTALHALFGVTGITRARGQWLSYLDIPALPTFHPAYLLRKPEDKRFVFDDLKALRARLSALPPREP